MKITLYIEGGGDGKDLKSALRRAFQTFFKKAGFTGKLPRSISCGGRRIAYDDFCIALADANKDEFPILLVDSESAVPSGTSPWAHLSRHDNWDKPSGASDDHIHIMTQVMETWFLADQQALAKYYGENFQSKMLPKNPLIEAISKDDVLKGLENSSKATTKGAYNKGGHSFEILAQIDPERVQSVAPWACRFLKTLDCLSEGITERVCREPSNTSIQVCEKP